MTDKALAARLREQATLYRAFNQTGRDRAGDLERAADLIEQMAQAEPVAAPLVLAFNEGYMSGHHDTVEACFVNIHPSDMDTYHADVVADLGLSLAPPAREPLTVDHIEDLANKHNANLWRYHAYEQDAIIRLIRAVEKAHGIRSEK